MLLHTLKQRHQLPPGIPKQTESTYTLKCVILKKSCLIDYNFQLEEKEEKLNKLN